MKVEIEASGTEEYGDFTNIKVYFSDGAWLELDVADAHTLDWDSPLSGGSLTVHHLHGEEDRLWAGVVWAHEHDYQHGKPSCSDGQNE